MGIVCHCPNGHRVKVKDHQAGKRGLCPTCGAKFSIPAEAAAETRLPLHAAAVPGELELPLGRFVPLDPAVIATLPRALPFGATARAAADAAAAAAAAAAAQQSLEPFAETMPLGVDPLAAEQTTVWSANPAGGDLHATIADRPDLSWRIAYPGGEASEPVDATTMQAWLAGGQAEGSELVWRADWPEWLPVREVFPEFFVGE
jgi:hypothetical protein